MKKTLIVVLWLLGLAAIAWWSNVHALAMPIAATAPAAAHTGSLGHDPADSGAK